MDYSDRAMRLKQKFNPSGLSPLPSIVLNYIRMQKNSHQMLPDLKKILQQSTHRLPIKQHPILTTRNDRGGVLMMIRKITTY